jgi:hypothetical protein
LFVAASTSAKAVTTYNDVWGYENEDGSEAYLMAIGFTQTGISDPYHTAYVDTTLVTALGRVAFNSATDEANSGEFPPAGDGSGGSELPGGEMDARAEVALAVQEDDIGEYEIVTNHAVACPFAPFTPALAFRFPVGSFRQTYAYRGTVTEGYHLYTVDCIGPCTATYQSTRTFNHFRGPFYVCGGIRFTFFGSTCIGRCNGSPVHAGCF